ncbi:HNH endonuclease [Mesorhizobium sp. M0213]|uniref:HNH endonuclease n=1 Tax=unclassified Mesorhizobium TaxID=325217 RepID=UPI003339E4A9
MLAAQQALIRREVEDGTGAAVGVETVRDGAQTGLRLWFDDLGRARSPIVELVPRGLKRYEARLRFASFSAGTITQMQVAQPEEKQLARALIRSAASGAEVTIPGQSLEDWDIRDSSFSIIALQKGVEDRFGADALTATCRAMVIPMLAAMAELYGYDPILPPEAPSLEGEIEGTVLISVVRRRERNPRNRLLCLRIHRPICGVCGTDPTAVYGDAGHIIEVHHIQPLSLAGEPRAYDPETDLIPLCPSCHRAAHTRRPMPWSPDELRAILGRDG